MTEDLERSYAYESYAVENLGNITTEEFAFNAGWVAAKQHFCKHEVKKAVCEHEFVRIGTLCYTKEKYMVCKYCQERQK